MTVRVSSLRELLQSPLIAHREGPVLFAAMVHNADLQRAVETIGQRWAEEVFARLPRHRRDGAWPGRMSEARALLRRAVIPLLSQGGHWPTAEGTDFETAARRLGQIAKAVWSARTGRSSGAPEPP